MKKTLLFIVILFTSGNLAAQELNDSDWANFNKYAEANKTTAKGMNAVFIGNSITEGWVAADPDFFTRNGYVGRGISGQVSAQMLARFRRDVLELEPKCVVILAGTNDLARNQGYVSNENIYGNIVSMAELANIHGIKVILCSILPVYEYRWRPGMEPAGKIIAINGMLREYARKNKFTYVDYHTVLKDERDGLPDKYSPDGVHLNLDGYKIMESIVKPAIDKAVKRSK